MLNFHIHHWLSRSNDGEESLHMDKNHGVLIALFAIAPMFLKIGWLSYLGRSKSDKHKTLECCDRHASAINGRTKVNRCNIVRDFNSNPI